MSTQEGSFISDPTLEGDQVIDYENHEIAASPKRLTRTELCDLYGRAQTDRALAMAAERPGIRDTVAYAGRMLANGDVPVYRVEGTKTRSADRLLCDRCGLSEWVNAMSVDPRTGEGVCGACAPPRGSAAEGAQNPGPSKLDLTSEQEAAFNTWCAAKRAIEAEYERAKAEGPTEVRLSTFIARVLALEAENRTTAPRGTIRVGLSPAAVRQAMEEFAPAALAALTAYREGLRELGPMPYFGAPVVPALQEREPPHEASTSTARRIAAFWAAGAGAEGGGV